MTGGIVKGCWTGGIASPSTPVPEVSQRAGIHLLRKGSNFAYTGFRSIGHAVIFRAALPEPDEWTVVNLRDEK